MCDNISVSCLNVLKINMVNGSFWNRNMETGENISVMLVDDYAPIRNSLRILLAKVRTIEIVAEAEDGQMAIEFIHKNRIIPDVIIMDVNMPVMNGIEATQWITSVFPDIKVIAFSSSDEEDLIESMYEVGASAYLTKGCGFGEIVSAIRSAVQGEQLCAETIE